MELHDIQQDYKNRVPYNEIRKKYKLKPYVQINKNLIQETQLLIDEFVMNGMRWNRIDVDDVLAYVNYYHYGIIFWDKEKDIESVEELFHFIDDNGWDFNMLLDYVRTNKDWR